MRGYVEPLWWCADLRLSQEKRIQQELQGQACRAPGTPESLATEAALTQDPCTRLMLTEKLHCAKQRYRTSIPAEFGWCSDQSTEQINRTTSGHHQKDQIWFYSASLRSWLTSTGHLALQHLLGVQGSLHLQATWFRPENAHCKVPRRP